MNSTFAAFVWVGQRYDEHMGGDDSNGWVWMAIPMTVMMVAVVALLVWGIMAVARSNHDSGSSAGAKSARDILNERYARGEIDTADYEERKSKLA